MSFLTLALAAALQGPAVASPPAQQPASPPPAPATATRITAVRAAQAPVIDGRDDDPVWATAPEASEFRQFSPTVNGDPAFRTAFRVAYDARNLYVFVRMYDPHPDSIMHALSRRDVRGPSDQVKVVIDSYDDKRSGFQMAVNPDGVKRDYSISNDDQEDDSWNGIWDVATKVDAQGWTAEYRIPMSQLRYSGAATHTFGFGIWRDIERLNQRVAWPEYSPVRTGFASQLGRLEGLDGIATGRHIEVTPYTVTKNQQVPGSGGGTPFSREQVLQVGGDVKVGITPNVTLDATVNPDFGQVEADPGVLNLTAFENFFAERRPFFVEGTGLYQFQLNCYIVVDCSTNEGLFYSRRIGRSPSLRGRFGDDGTANATPIAAATKLTGRTPSGFAFGVLDAYTRRVHGPEDRTVEPGTNYSVLRAQQDLRGGETSIGVIGTAVNRSLDTLARPYLPQSAYVGGATFRNRFHQKQYEFAAQVTASTVSGSEDAIARVQRSAVHYLQRPEASMALDTTRTSLGGYAGQLKFGKYGGGITRFETSVVHQSAGFEVNDLGFLQRADLTDWSTWAALSFRDRTKYFNWAQLNANTWQRWNTDGTRLENAVNTNGHIGFRNNWDAHLGTTIAGLSPIYCDRCTRGGPLVRQSGGIYPWMGLNTDQRKPVSGGVFLNFRRRDEGRSTGVNASPYVALRVSTRLGVNVSVNYGRDHDDAQWYGNFDDDAGVTHYSFAHLDQRTLSTAVRMNYTAIPTLTFEFYGEPFIATGTYSDIRELSDTPKADRFTDRYVSYAPPPDADRAFRFVQLRTNAVARWEYRPGSTLFVVWAHGRQASSNDNPNQPWNREYRDLFSLHPDNTFLVKFAYWFNR